MWLWIPALASLGRNDTGELPALRLALADFLQNFRRVLAKLWRGAGRCHRRAVEHDRRAHTGDAAGLGLGQRQRQLHAAVFDMRIGEHLIERIDRAGRHADRFESVC